jgi:hypothetical protein
MNLFQKVLYNFFLFIKRLLAAYINKEDIYIYMNIISNLDIFIFFFLLVKKHKD